MINHLILSIGLMVTMQLVKVKVLMLDENFECSVQGNNQFSSHEDWISVAGICVGAYCLLVLFLIHLNDEA